MAKPSMAMPHKAMAYRVVRDQGQEQGWDQGLSFSFSFLFVFLFLFLFTQPYSLTPVAVEL